MRLDHGIGWSLNGFDLSGTDPAGVRWLVKDVEGWDDPAGAVGGVVQKDYADGGWLEPTLLAPPSLVAKVRLLAPTRESSIRARDEFKSIIPVRLLAPLVLSDGGLVRHRRVKQEGKPSIKQASDHLVEMSVQLVSPDVRIFSGDGTAPFTYSASTGLPDTAGGWQLPAQAPLQVAAAVSSGSVVVSNAGDAVPPVKVRIKGPVTNPSITANDGGRMNFALTLSSGQTLEVDLDRRTVKLNGVNRRNTLSGPWIIPQTGTELKFNASTYNTTARMTVQWSDAWR
ncbi:phage distal tail protein [Arthrobacter sp. MP_2.3]|uniref:phage distal tail protein n=1 Tax=Arthrobacter sp. MP_2.3 TaxID=3349633 RepID=UPI0038D3B86A